MVATVFTLCACAGMGVLLLVPRIANFFYERFPNDEGLFHVTSIGTLTLLFAIPAGIGWTLLSDWQEKERADRLSEYAEIAESPGKWLAGRLKTVPDPTVGGILLVIDGKIGEAERFSRGTNDAREIMEYGRVVEALKAKSECVRRLREPIRCADSE